MEKIGFSTGSIAYGDFRKAIEILKQTSSNAVELSALREAELPELVEKIDELDLNQFDYIAFHAPSKLEQMTEKELVGYLEGILNKGIPIVLHPDVIQNYALWEKFGRNLCIENMDKRKPLGQTFQNLQEIFNHLPEASFCFDLAHLRQIDPTMQEGIKMLQAFRDRLAQLHVSDVNPEGKHEPLNLEALLAYKKLAPLFSKDIPVIIESILADITTDAFEAELKLASYVLNQEEFSNHLHQLDPDTSYFIEAKNGDVLAT